MKDVLPKILYHYMKVDDKSLKVLSHNEVWFTSPTKFNDPFDCKIQITCNYEFDACVSRIMGRDRIWATLPGMTTEEKERRVRVFVESGMCTEGLTSLMHRHSGELGILCLSARKYDLLMWAHYADKHRGICLGFRADNEFFGRALDVTYAPIYPELLCRETTDQQKAETALLVKADCWRYEEEYRIIDTNKGEGLRRIPEDAIAEVVLGSMISEENRVRVIECCQGRKVRPTVYQAKVASNRFAVEFDHAEYM